VHLVVFSAFSQSIRHCGESALCILLFSLRSLRVLLLLIAEQSPTICYSQSVCLFQTCYYSILQISDKQSVEEVFFGAYDFCGTQLSQDLHICVADIHKYINKEINWFVRLID